MAEFIPNMPQGQAPDWLRYVYVPPERLQNFQPRPVQGSSGAGDALKGIGDVVGLAAKGTDEAIQNSSMKFLKQGTDKINSDAGLDDAAKLAGNGVNPTGRLSNEVATQNPNLSGDSSDSGVATSADHDLFFGKDKVANQKGAPPGVAKLGSQVEKIQNAYETGKMAPSYYYGQLQSLVTQARAQYPGYRDIIDKQISEITGVQPANALRRSVLADQDAAAKESQAKNTAENTWYRNNGPELEILYPGITGPGGLEKYSSVSKQEMFHGVNVFKSQKMMIETRKSQLELGELDDKTRLQRTDAVLNDELNLTTHSFLNGVTNSSAPGQSLGGMVKHAQDMLTAGKTIPADQQQALETQSGIARSQLEVHLRQIASDPNGPYGKLPQEKIEQRVKGALDQFDAYMQPITNSKWGVVGANASMVKAMNDQSFRDAFSGSSGEMLRRVDTANKILGPQGLALIMDSAGGKGIQPEVMNAVKTLIVGDMADPNAVRVETPNSYVNKVIKANGGDPRDPKATIPPAAAKGIIDTYTKVLTEPSVPLETKKAAAMELFANDKSYGFVNRFTDKNDRAKVVSTFASPAMTKSIEAIGDKQVWASYKRWTVDNVGAQFKDSMDEIQNTMEGPEVNRHGLSYSFNPQSGHIEYEFSEKYQGTGPDRRTSGLAHDPTVQAVNRLNQGLDLLRPILRHDGQSIEDELPKVLKDNGFNLEEMADKNDMMNGKSHAKLDMETFRNGMIQVFDTLFGGRAPVLDRAGGAFKKGSNINILGVTPKEKEPQGGSQ